MKKSSSSWKNRVIGFFLIFFISSFGAVVIDYGLHIYITTMVFFVMVIVAGIIGFFANRKSKVPLSIVIGFVIGVILIPYMQFIVGKMDLYAVDPPEFRESVIASEIRLKMGTFYMTNDQWEEIAVIKDIPEKKLYPGGNEVHLGTINMPPGNYKGGRMEIEKIEVDISIDLDKEVEILMATATPLLPSQANIDEIRQSIKTDLASAFSETNLQSFAPTGIQFTNIRSDGSKVYFTVLVEPPEIQFPLPTIPYPTGTGGPDITLDIVLNSAGYPTTIKPILHMPPGAPEINIPDLTPDLSRYVVSPSGPSQGDIQQRIQQEIQSRAGPGGCLSESECSSYCSEESHIDECLAYAQARGIPVSTPSE